MPDKKNLSERDICSKYITCAIRAAGWNIDKHILEEVPSTYGKIFVSVKLMAGGKRKRIYYLSFYYNYNFKAGFQKSYPPGYYIRISK